MAQNGRHGTLTKPNLSHSDRPSKTSHSTLARWISFGFITAISFSNIANAQIPTFTCDGYPYQILSNRLHKFDPITLTYTQQGPTNSPSINGAGFNSLDNYAYALNSAGIYRLGSDGTRELVSTGIGGALSYVGTMDESGNFYGLKRTNRKILIKMDIAASDAAGTTVLTEVVFTGATTPPGTGDFVYVADGLDEYVLLARDSGLYWYNLQTQAIDNATATLPSGVTSLVFGAMWTDSGGRIWGFHNAAGDIYELLEPFTNPTWSLVADLPANGNNDGFSCKLAPFPALPPIAQDDAFTTQIDTDVSGNLIDDNGNGKDEDPDGAVLSVLWSDPATSAPVNGTISATNSDGSFTYTPNPGYYGLDSFDYVLSDGSATDSATVTFTIRADNSDLPSEYADAVHNIIDKRFLGSDITDDQSPNSNTSADAAGDTDEGLVSDTTLSVGTTNKVTVDVVEAIPESTFLQAWIDWNLDDDFDDADEQVAINLTDDDGDGVISFGVDAPIITTTIETFLRFRWSSKKGLDVSSTAPDGEVEDYQIKVLADLDITANKSVAIWDPLTTGVYALPGNDVIYTITTTNAGDVPSDVDTIFLTDKIPSEVTFYHGDIDDGGPETNPVSFVQNGVTGLTFTYADDVGYSKGSTTPLDMSDCTDIPAIGYDPSVTYICFAPKGQFLGGTPDPSFELSFRAKIK